LNVFSQIVTADIFQFAHNQLYDTAHISFDQNEYHGLDVSVCVTTHHVIIGATVSRVKFISHIVLFHALSVAVSLNKYIPSVSADITVSQVLVGLNVIIHGHETFVRFAEAISDITHQDKISFTTVH